MRIASRLQKESFHYRLLVAGGGAAGVSCAAKFAKKLPSHAVAILEPSERHCYQPGLTLAAAKLMPFKRLFRRQADVIPSGVSWFRAPAAAFEPSKNNVLLSDGRKISYDFLVIATGLEARFDLIKGLNSEEDILAAPGLCSIYTPKTAEKTALEFDMFNGGTALFTFPNTPIKCAGAPQKICYLFEEQIRCKGIRDKTRVCYATTLPKIFGIERYANSLMKIIAEREIELRTQISLNAVDTKSQVARFEALDENGRPIIDRGLEIEVVVCFAHKIDSIEKEY